MYDGQAFHVGEVINSGWNRVTARVDYAGKRRTRIAKEHEVQTRQQGSSGSKKSVMSSAAYTGGSELRSSHTWRSEL